MYVVICKIDHYIHIHWCIVMGLGHNDPWVESHMWPQQTWGQRSYRVNDLWFKFLEKKISVSTYFDVFSNVILQWLQKYVLAKAGETRGLRTALLSRTEWFGRFLFCFFYSNLGLPSAKSLQNGSLSFSLSRRKIKLVTSHKMASHLLDMNIIFQKNMCLTNFNHYKHSKMMIFWVCFNKGKNRHCI